MLRTIAILAAGAVTLWVAIGVTANFTIARQFPGSVRAIWPAGVMAKVAEGRDLLSVTPQPSVATIDAMRKTLRAAALREPIDTQALGTLAALDDLRGDHSKAQTLFRLSEAASRRNSLTELWLLEDAVARNEIGEALVHYDRAMRVTVELRSHLLPVLNNAASDPAILNALVPILRQRPLWWKDYLQFLGQNGSDSRVMTAVLASTRPNIGIPEERVLAENILRRMVAQGGEREAILAANRLEGISGGNRSLRGGDFDTTDGVLPFAWWLRDESDIRAYRDTVPNGTMGLRIETTSDTSGGVAQQLVGLSRGSYMLSGVVGNVPADPASRPTIAVACGNAQPIARFILPGAPDAGTSFRFRFIVPGGDCPTQWISIMTASIGDTNIWLDGLKLASAHP